MGPMLISIIVYAALSCCCATGIDVKHQAAYNRVIECISEDTHANLPGQDLSWRTVVCDAFKVLDECLIRPFDSDTGAHSSDILDFYRAYQLQRVILIGKSNMCPEPLPYQKLKELVDESEIMERENLTSIEKDDYVKCLGQINEKCYKTAKNHWEHRSNNFRVFLSYVDCFDAEKAKAKQCDNAPIANHYNDVLQAYKKHTQEKHGILGEMIKDIDH